ncbi:MAG: VWA domain-containing protein [Alphaproteobacteria bacterium]|nr:VWA domain-containing protein [Alphaproteobacteria bacterium]
MFIEFITNFHFLRLWVLLFLVIPFMFYFYIFKNNENVSSWEKVCDKNLLDYLLIKKKNSKRKLGVALLYFGLICSIFSAAGPTWKKTDLPALDNNVPVMIVLNMSSDMMKTDVKPDRLSKAKLKIGQLLKELGSVQSALIVYTNEPFLVSPLSSDSQLIINLSDALNTDIMPVNGDRLDRAIKMADEKIKSAGYENGDIVVFTAQSPMSFSLAVDAAKSAVKNFNKVHIVNVSSEKNDKLKQIANDGNGIYLQDGENIKVLIDDIQKQKENYQKSKNNTADWLDFGWYMLIIPALCCLGFFRKGVLMVLLFLSISFNAYAGFWSGDNFSAMRSFKNKDYEKAALMFKNQKWKGAAHYKAGNYADAVKLFEGKTDVESMYNYGNALAKSGKIDEAIKVYENILQQDKSHEDAKYNWEYLKKQQQNKSKNQKQDNKQNNEQKQKSDNNENRDNNQQNQQNQSAKQDDNQEENKDNQEAKAQNVMSSAQADEENNDKKGDDNSKENQSKQNQKTEQSAEEQKAPKMGAKQGSNDEKYDEEVHAKIQKFREVPEDKGGLIRAFIQKEYLKNRYGD